MKDSLMKGHLIKRAKVCREQRVGKLGITKGLFLVHQTNREPTLSVKDSFQLSKSPNSSSEDSHGCQSLGSDSESMTFISDGGVEDCGQGLSAMEEKAPTEKGWKEVIVATILLHPKLPPRSSLRLFLILLAGIRFFPLG